VTLKWAIRNKKYYIDKGYIFTKCGDEFEVKVEDLSSKNNSKVLATCDECNKSKDVVFGDYKRNIDKNNKYLCKECAIKEKGKNIIGTKYNKKPRDLKKEIYNLVEDEYTLLESYMDSKTKLLFKHNICGETFSMLPSNFLRGHRCPHCFKIAKKDTQTFKKEIYSLVGDEYEVLGEYINKKTKVLIKHNNKECGFYEWEVRPDSLKRGHRCPKCYENNINKSSIIINNNLKEKYKDEFIFLSPYVNGKQNIKIKCVICGEKYEKSPYLLLKKTYECKKCNEQLIKKETRPTKKHIKRDTEYVRKEIEQITNKEYSMIGEYSETKIPIIIKHNVCGHEWSIRIHDFLDKECRCPKCYIENRCKELGISISQWGNCDNKKQRKLTRWSKKVRNKDNNKCVICSSIVNLNAHHLNGWNWDIDNRTNIDNGVTLCEECHKKFHSIYGYGNNSKEQFNEYLKLHNKIYYRVSNLHNQT
jgi:predicted Zn-ribbon and HTH transcriptional regulator